MSASYELKQVDSNVVRSLMRERGLPHFVVSTLVARGLKSKKEIDEFLEPSLERDWRNPLLIPGLSKVVDRIEDAIKQNKHIVVFGDFDLDGISSTAVLTRGCRALGANVTPFIPDRINEGYGITKAAYERLTKLSPDIIVTVDCGIANGEEIAKIEEKGIDVVVTDHHEASDLIPKDVAICDPKYKGDAEDQVLAGVGVALKVVQALGCRFGFPHLWHSYTDLATLGTIADMMPLLGQNRSLVAEGLKKISTNPRTCIAALLEVSGIEAKDLNSTNVSFSLVPRLNAAGRMSKADVALDLLLCDKVDEAQKLAEELNELNTKRKTIENELKELALAEVDKKYKGERCIIVSGKGWHEGVKGIVASHLVDKYGVPAIIFSIDGDEARGSGRAVGNIDLFKIVDEQSDLLTRYGGHKSAVGITIPTEKLTEFSNRLERALEKYDKSDFHRRVEIDTVVSLDELTLKNVELFEKIAPYGQANQMPILLAKNVTVFEGRAVGQNKNHFLCKLSNGMSKISCINFNCENIDKLISADALCNAIFSVETEVYRNVKVAKCKAIKIAPCTECPALSSLCSDSTAEFIEDLFSKDKTEKRQVTNEINEQNARNRATFEQLAKEDLPALERRIVYSLIGNNQPHDTQRAILEKLKSGTSTLGIMATGRGKSFIFQTHSALLAMSQGSASLFVYPLRALMSDQAFHLQEHLSTFGIKCAVLNGQTTQSEREKIYRDLADGEVDIILTTPEYLSFHADRLAESKRIKFLVVDEAHHIGQAKAGTRLSYLGLKDVAEKLGNPTILAVTATADDEFVDKISNTLSINSVLTDSTSRSNLHINDMRNIAHREDYLAHLLASGGKTVIYVNSREQSVAVARRERLRVPQLGPYIGFYNAGLSREERTRIEKLFRSGEIQVLVATSAFGEGIDIPDIRNVVLYHMPFSDVEFNQMSGRAGRDGGESWIHLLFGKRDATINDNLLKDLTPTREVMAIVYKKLMELQNESESGEVELDLANLESQLSRVRLNKREFSVSKNAILTGLNVFDELGLISHRENFEGNTTKHFFAINKSAPKVELTDSTRYCEGLGEIENFKNFKNWIMNADIEEMTNQIIYPITPKRTERRN